MSNEAWGGFGDLDLSEVQEREFSRLPPGSWAVKCTSAELDDVAGKKGCKKLVATFEEVGGNGTVRINFNIRNSNPEAQEIGLSQLKTFLVKAGHPNPDKPRDIASLVGLKVGVVTGFGKQYKSSRNDKMVTPVEIKNFFDLNKTEPGGPSGEEPKTGSVMSKAAKKTTDDFDDDIPF